jgi:hypothetical protein
MQNKMNFKFQDILFLSLLILVQYGYSERVKIIEVKGDVHIRQGVEETWQTAKPGILLEDIDSILSGKNGRAVLETDDGRRFELSSNSQIDIADLRQLSNEELFLHLMKEKLKKIGTRQGKTPLRVGTVSAVHGSSQDSLQNSPAIEMVVDPEPVLNGIRDLFIQDYYPNTILKIHRFIDLYPVTSDCGELSYYLGRSFEELQQPGQAMEAYRTSIQAGQQVNCPNSKWLLLAQEHLKSLEQN